MKIATNTIVLVAGWIVILGIGGYVTFIRQPKEIEVLQKAEEVSRMKNAELTSLQTEHVALSEVTNETLRKWHARYKVIPDELTTADVVGRINELTGEGFKNFDVSFGGTAVTSDFSYHTFSITGRGYFTNLYRFVWEIENGRDLFRIRDLSLNHIDLTTQDPETEAPRMEVMVSFTMRLEAYFDGIDGASAPAEGPTALAVADGLPPERTPDLPPVPRELLPARQPALNPFFPGILQQIPPNTYGLIDVEQSALVSIVGQKAVFNEGGTFRTAGPGDAVYLGHVVTVDPQEGRVLVRLNKGGIYDEVELRLEAAGARPGRPATPPGATL